MGAVQSIDKNSQSIHTPEKRELIEDKEDEFVDPRSPCKDRTPVTKHFIDPRSPNLPRTPIM